MNSSSSSSSSPPTHPILPGQNDQVNQALTLLRRQYPAAADRFIGEVHSGRIASNEVASKLHAFVTMLQRTPPNAATQAHAQAQAQAQAQQQQQQQQQPPIQQEAPAGQPQANASPVAPPSSSSNNNNFPPAPPAPASTATMPAATQQAAGGGTPALRAAATQANRSTPPVGTNDTTRPALATPVGSSSATAAAAGGVRPGTGTGPNNNQVLTAQQQTLARTIQSRGDALKRLQAMGSQLQHQCSTLQTKLNQLVANPSEAAANPTEKTQVETQLQDTQRRWVQCKKEFDRHHSMFQQAKQQYFTLQARNSTSTAGTAATGNANPTTSTPGSTPTSSSPAPATTPVSHAASTTTTLAPSSSTTAPAAATPTAPSATASPMPGTTITTGTGNPAAPGAPAAPAGAVNSPRPAVPSGAAAAAPAPAGLAPPRSATPASGAASPNNAPHSTPGGGGARAGSTGTATSRPSSRGPGTAAPASTTTTTTTTQQQQHPQHQQQQQQQQSSYLNSAPIPSTLQVQPNQTTAAQPFPNPKGARPTLNQGLAGGPVLAAPPTLQRPNILPSGGNSSTAGAAGATASTSTNDKPASDWEGLLGLPAGGRQSAGKVPLDESDDELALNSTNPNLRTHGRLVSKRRIQSLVGDLAPGEHLEGEVEDLLLEVADEFIDSTTRLACRLAKHRKSDRLEVKDVQLHLERNWNLRVPFPGSNPIAPPRARGPAAQGGK